MRLVAETTFVLASFVATGCGSSTKDNQMHDAATDPVGQPDLKPDSKSDAAAPDLVDSKPASDLAPEALSDATSAKDQAPELPSTVDAFVPGPIVPVVVNSGNTASYDLADGTWKVFSFDTRADHLYCVSTLGDGVVGYFGGETASPSDYELTTKNGALVFPEYATGTRYLAVAATGGSASGTFQVADGGELVTVGDNTVDFSATDVGHYRAFRFNVAPGHNYTVSITGTTKNPVGLGLSPKAERGAGGSLAYPFLETSSTLPIADKLVPLESIVDSYTRFYFLFLKVAEPVSLTINITLAF
jgi:hypothetical protein